MDSSGRRKDVVELDGWLPGETGAGITSDKWVESRVE